LSSGGRSLAAAYSDKSTHLWSLYLDRYPRGKKRYQKKRRRRRRRRERRSRGRSIGC